MKDRDFIRAYGVEKNKKNVDVYRLSKIERDNLRNGVLPPSKELFEYLPILDIKEPISIIVTAYKTENYIEECLNSIKNQTYFIDNDNYEILVGIDGCEDTLKKILEIKNNYKNLRVFMMKSNRGTYITSNTLIKMVNNENIIRFDSDDIMMPELINEVMYYNKEYNIIRFFYFSFYNNDINLLRHYQRFAHGALFLKKSLFNALGGYQPWMCAADTEFLIRGSTLIKQMEISKPLFYRRIHENSLISNHEFGIRSDKRKKYIELIGKEINIKIRKITNKYTEY